MLYLQAVLLSFMFYTHKNKADNEREKKKLYGYQEGDLPGCLSAIKIHFFFLLLFFCRMV